MAADKTSAASDKKATYLHAEIYITRFKNIQRQLQSPMVCIIGGKRERRNKGKISETTEKNNHRNFRLFRHFSFADSYFPCPN